MTPSPERLAVFPGSFDPVTHGHVDIVRRALALADRVIVAVAHSPSQSKRGMFSVEERVAMIEEVFADEPRVEAAEFTGLLVDFARRRQAGLVVRGLRSGADFEYELPMARMNRSLDPGLDTVFLAATPESSFVSASLVREVATLGGDISAYVPAGVARRIRERVGAAGER